MYAASRFSLCRSSKLEAVLEKADGNKERARIGMSDDRVNKEEKDEFNSKDSHFAVIR
jgi:hypothetical protein